MKTETWHHIPEDECMNFKLVLGENTILSIGRIAHSGFLPDGGRVSDVEFTGLSDQGRFSLEEYLLALPKWPKPRNMLSAGERNDGEAGVIKGCAK